MIKFKHITDALSFYQKVKFKRIKKFNDSSQGLNLCIFSVSRSGSTWFAEILNSIPLSTIVTEPFYRYPEYKIQRGNPYSFPEQVGAPFLWDQYIPKDADVKDLYDYTRKLLNREIFNLKLNHRSQVSKVANAQDFIYKFCFANRKMEWMHENFDFKSILLNRHPCAVINSQLKYGFNREKNRKFSTLDNYYEDPFILKNYDYINSLSKPEEVFAAKYALSYHDLHNKIIDGSINNSYSIFYEHLLLDPDRELKLLFDFLGFEVSSNTYSAYERKSRTSLRKKSIVATKQIEQWKKDLTKTQIDDILKVTQNLGIDYYTSNPIPEIFPVSESQL